MRSSQLIQPALGRAPLIGRSIGWGKRSRRGRIGRTQRRGRLNGSGRRRSGSRRNRRPCLDRRAWCNATAGGRIQPLLMGNEFLIAGSTRARRHVLGHAAGPRRPRVRYETGERAASPQRQGDAEECRKHQPPPVQSCRQISSPICRIRDAPLRRVGRMLPALAARFPTPTEIRFHGRTVSAAGIGSRTVAAKASIPSPSKIC